MASWTCRRPLSVPEPSPLELEQSDIIGGDHIAFHAGHFTDLDDATLAVAHAFDLYDDVQRSDNLKTNGPGRQIELPI